MRTICTLFVRNFIYGHRRVGTWRIGCFSFALALLLGITADWCLTARACACATALLVSDELDPPPTLTSVLVEVCDDDSCAARFLAGFGLPIDPQSSAALVTAGVVQRGGNGARSLAFKSCIFGVLAAQALTNLSCLAICAPALPGGGVFYLPCLKFCVGRVNAGFVKEYLACVVLLEAARTVTFAVHQECRLQCGGA
jgi:hypothetical protein